MSMRRRPLSGVFDRCLRGLREAFGGGDVPAVVVLKDVAWDLQAPRLRPRGFFYPVHLREGRWAEQRLQVGRVGVVMPRVLLETAACSRAWQSRCEDVSSLFSMSWPSKTSQAAG